MSDLAPPRSAERALEALGADPDFCEAVIGDLAEEFAIRAAWDGPVVARRWYFRESLRVAPHLLRNWWGCLQRRDIGYFANVTALASFQARYCSGLPSWARWLFRMRCAADRCSQRISC